MAVLMFALPATSMLLWMSATSRRSRFLLLLKESPCLPTTESLSGGSFRLPYRMETHTTKRVSTALIWLKQSSPRRRFSPPVTSSIFGIRRVAKTPRYRVGSNLQAAMAHFLCTSTFSNAMGSTIATQTPSLSTMTPSASLATVQIPRLSNSHDPHNNLLPPQRLVRSNQRYGCYGLAPRANTN